jgi:hypothetical protein
VATTPTRPLWPLVIFGLMAALILLSDRAPRPRPNPEPRPAGPDLVTVFAAAPDRDKARSDALAFSHLCESLAIKIEYDGRLSPPRISTGVQCDELRRWAREYGLLANCHRSPKRLRPFQLADFLPPDLRAEVRRTSGIRLTAGNLRMLKPLFTKDA